MKIFYSQEHRKRQPKTELHGGTLRPPFECAERLDFILAELDKRRFGEIVAPGSFGIEPVTAIHDSGFVAFLETAWQEWSALGYEGEAIPTIWPTRTMRSDIIPEHFEAKLGYYCLANETSISDGTWEAACASKDVALSATQDVLGGARSAFGLCRPPGHHAAIDQYGGYCFFNNAAIAAQHARDHGVERAAILDVDFHHGNGTQNIFYERGDVLFVSLHGDPDQAFPHFLGFADECGAGAGKGCNLNFPMPPGTGFDAWRARLKSAFDPIRRFEPGLVIVSLGVDTFEKDPISFFKLASGDFTTMGADIASLGLPTVFLMEGGYAVEEVGINTVNTLQGFAEAKQVPYS
ncbi:MAG: histone deacetylase family protein [Nitratireductor sp.]|nr:histone deacetylase family protein [Nitratireductor sp.]